MSAASTAPGLAHSTTPMTPPPRPEPVAFHFTQSDSFAPLLKQLGVSLLVTTYQANKLLVLREQSGGLSILVRSFERPMGVACDSGRIALGTRDQVWTFRDAPDIAPQVEPLGAHDACFIPRASHVTGDIGVHEVAWAAAAATTAAAGPWTSCGSSARASPACAPCAATTASSRAGARRSSCAGGGRPMPPQRAGGRVSAGLPAPRHLLVRA